MFRLRYITIIPVVFSLAGSALMFILGAAGLEMKRALVAVRRGVKETSERRRGQA